MIKSRLLNKLSIPLITGDAMLYRMKHKIERLLSKTGKQPPTLTDLKLPNFFIIGANKAGTTSLHYYCSQHPEIFMSENKEPMFFTAKGPLPTKKDEANTSSKQSLFYQFFTLQESCENVARQ